MKRLRKALGIVLAATFVVPGSGFAQTVRISLEAPVAPAPGFAAPAPLALSASVLAAPSLAVSAPALSVLPAPSIVPIAAALIAPVSAAKPAALAAVIHAAPSNPDQKPVEAQKSDADKTFDGSVTAEPAAEPVVAAAPVAEKPRLAPAELNRLVAPLGRVAAPRPWLEKAKVTGSFAALTGLAVAMNAPFDHIAPIVAAAIMAPMMSFMGLFIYGSSQYVSDGPALEGKELKPSEESLSMIKTLAAEAKVPAPARVKLMAGDKVQAQVGARDDKGYEIRFSEGFEKLSPAAKRAILRHEFAHERYHDMPWFIAQAFMVSFAPMIALMSLDGKSPLEGIMATAIAATAILLFPSSLQHSEYMADQYAASKEEGAGPLARFFVEDADNTLRAASALSGEPFSSETGWKRRGIAAWDRLKTLFRAHPSHERRVARLARLARPKD